MFSFDCSVCNFSGDIENPKVKSILECPDCQTLFHVQSINSENKTIDMIKFEVGTIIETTADELREELAERVNSRFPCPHCNQLITYGGLPKPMQM